MSTDVYGCNTLTTECPTLPKLYETNNNVANRNAVQNEERSAADSSQFAKGVVQYAYVKSNYTDKQQTPKFASHADYIIWKRMNAQLHYK